MRIITAESLKESTCLSKETYLSEKGAKFVAIKKTKKRHYKCPYCLNYHISSNTNTHIPLHLIYRHKDGIRVKKMLGLYANGGANVNYFKSSDGYHNITIRG